MNELSEKSLRLLELPQLLSLLEERCVSDAAKAKARNLRPATDYDEVVRLLDETDAARTMMMRRGAPPFAGVRDVGEALGRAERGGMLSTTELLRIAALLGAARRTKDYFDGGEEQVTAIDNLFRSLHPNHFLEEKITTAILDENEIADAASPELADIRRHKRASAAKGRQILQRIISSASYARVLQEAIITQRAGRFVVPVKAECRGDLPGLVHDVSSSGATIFVEPMGVVSANNELKEWEAREKKEVERILFALSAEAAGFAEDILWNYDILIHLDLIFARGELGDRMEAMRPEVRKDGSTFLRHARHPLLDPAKAVPIDIEIGGSFDTLVITGPNTGGKTVSLKTLGLLCLMAQCGLHLPCADRSAVSIYNNVLADIGDEQSIEQNLSTFSAHMKNIVEILSAADGESLILFDELGAGTDPVEGAALAIAIIQKARNCGAKVAATTHYAELKTFAMTTAGVENASCEFDVETLCPTYRLLIGIPGKSNAFAIAGRLGLSEEVIVAARTQMSGESVRFEDILTQLESKRQQLEKEKTEIDRLYAQREEDARKAREFRTQMERAKENARAHGEKEAKRILRDARAAADETFRELDALRKAQKKQSDAQTANETRAAVFGKLNAADEAAGRSETYVEPIPKPSRPITEGDLVEIPGTNRRAKVVKAEQQTLTLQLGSMQMKVKRNGVRLIEEAERAMTEKKVAKPMVTRQIFNHAAVSRELDIRGMETLEAENVLANYIDAAVVGHLESVTIIHGKGTGALRQAVHAFLRRQKSVKRFRLGTYGEGENGVTIVEFQ